MKRGEKQATGKTMKDILRIIHTNKNGIVETEIRDIVKAKLRIREKTVVRNHLTSLEERYRLIGHELEQGIGNRWISQIHSNINNAFQKCSLPPLTSSQLELVDYLVKRSPNFLDMLVKKTDWCKTHAQIMQYKHIIVKKLGFYTKDLEEIEKVSNWWFIGVSEACRFHDLVFGGCDHYTQEDLAEYEAALSSFTGKEITVNGSQNIRNVQKYIKEEVSDIIHLDIAH